MPLRRLLRKRQNWLNFKGNWSTYMDKTGRNGMRVGDILTKRWKDSYTALTKKHLKMLDFYNVDLEYDLGELETQFSNPLNPLKMPK